MAYVKGIICKLHTDATPYSGHSFRSGVQSSLPPPVSQTVRLCSLAAGEAKSTRPTSYKLPTYVLTLPVAWGLPILDDLQPHKPFPAGLTYLFSSATFSYHSLDVPPPMHLIIIPVYVILYMCITVIYRSIDGSCGWYSKFWLSLCISDFTSIKHSLEFKLKPVWSVSQPLFIRMLLSTILSTLPYLINCNWLLRSIDLQLLIS